MNGAITTTAGEHVEAEAAPLALKCPLGLRDADTCPLPPPSTERTPGDVHARSGDSFELPPCPFSTHPKLLPVSFWERRRDLFCLFLPLPLMTCWKKPAASMRLTHRHSESLTKGKEGPGTNGPAGVQTPEATG